MGEEGGYFEGICDEEIKYDTFSAGKKLTVNVKGESKVYKAETVCQVNPPKFDNSEDMADLTFLGDACVLWNSVVRYQNELIYTYSGLFCIAINPYKRYPIYTLRTMELYVGKRRNECWPHIFAIAEGAYQGMSNTGDNQSILITGESGAGKTENTKKVISYFATICSSGKRKEERPPWPSSRARSASLRLSWPPPSPALVRPPRPSREPSARPRSSPSPRVRTRRTRTACPSSPPSCRTRSRPTSSRSRRLRRLPPSTWPSSARPSRSS